MVLRMQGAEVFGRRAQRRAERWAALVGLGAALAWGVRYGLAAGTGAILGAVVALVNFRWLRQFVTSTLPASAADAGGGPDRKARKRIYRRLLARYILLLLPFCAILAGLYWPAVAFLCGLLTVPAAVLVEMLGALTLRAGQALFGRHRWFGRVPWNTSCG